MAANRRVWTHLIRFIAKEDGLVHIGQIDAQAFPDVGLSAVHGDSIVARVVTGSVFDGVVTDQELHVDRLLSPLSMEQTPIIRCLGLNYRDHAREANMAIPKEPVLFIKPRTSLSGPSPAKIVIPKLAQDDTADYEAEMAVIISRDGKDIPESDALDYVLGYTCSNDVSARAQQLKNSQWCFGKGMDGSAPIGPVLVSPAGLPYAHKANIKAIHNQSVVQDSNTAEMIFDVATTIAFLSQGTTLERGTIILTGTGPGIGMARDPKIVLRHGDDMRVEIEGIGTLVNEVHYES
ncbi:hypothetical protein LTR95_003393 [Oleoguttula sp. CCFEE 5521]